MGAIMLINEMLLRLKHFPSPVFVLFLCLINSNFMCLCDCAPSLIDGGFQKSENCDV
jgi:hypothetical protein